MMCSATILAAAMLTGCQVKPPSVRLADVEVGQVGLTQIDLVLVFEATNFNTFPIHLQALQFQCATADGPFAHGAITEGVDIPAQGSAKVRAPVSVEYEPLVAAVERMGNRDGCPYELTGTGTFRVLGATVTRPVRHAGTVPAIRFPQWRFEGVAIRMSEEKLAAMLDFSVKNESSCDFPVVSFDGALKVGQKSLLAIGRCPVKVLPARQTTKLTIPVELTPSAAIELGQAIRRGHVTGKDGLHVDGHLKLSAPGSLRDMLLGKKSQ